MTSSYWAGKKPAASLPSLPAATAKVTPALTAAQMAWWTESPFVAPQLWSSVSVVAPPRLMLAIWTVLACCLTQSMPHRICEPVPLPAALSTLIDQMRAPGATPTTPEPLSIAPIVPATCVPWPLLSL